jgi:hypothetical protein
MAFSFGGLGRSLGDFGSQVGQGQDIALDWRQRLQNLAIQQAKQKQDALMAPLLLQEVQTRLKQMQSPQNAGIVPTQGGGRGGVTFDPNTGTYRIQNLVPGAPPEPQFKSLQQAAAYYLQKGDFQKLAAVNSEIEKTKTQKNPPLEEMYYGITTDAQGRRVGIRKDTGKLEAIPSEGNMKFKEPPDPNAAFDRWVKEQNYRDTHKDESTPAVKTVLNAQKALQTLELGIQKTNRQFSIWNPETWGSDPTLQALAQNAMNDFQSKRDDAIAALTAEGKPIPEWLTKAGGAPTAPPTVPPPPGFVINK